MNATLQVAGGLLGLFVVGCVSLSLAQQQIQHPAVKKVKGDAGVDFTACAECHADKTTAPVVHPAMELGCDTCHEVDQDEDWTEVFLVTEGNDLCFTCHDDKHPEPSQVSLHLPVRTGRCVDCHDAHSTEAEALLRQPTESREAGENLCLGCHATIAAQINKQTQHMAVDLGCATCHTTHKSNPADAPEGTFHLTGPEPGLCLDCHEAEDAALKQAHVNQPFARSRCSECHNPHGSDAPKLVNNFIHAAFEMGCETCHQEPQEGKVVLQEGAGREMCLLCHSDVQEQLEQAQLTHFPLEMDSGCIACHSPHAATYSHLLKQGPVRTCLSCHTELAEARVAKANVHRPVYEQSCVICHQPHTGKHARLLRAEVNDLCLECHNKGFTRALQVRIRGNVPMKLFDDTVAVSTAHLEGAPTIPLQKGQDKGHPSIGVSHPVSGKYPLGDNMTCLTCHTPHTSVDRKLLATGGTGISICSKCH